MRVRLRGDVLANWRSSSDHVSSGPLPEVKGIAVANTRFQLLEFGESGRLREVVAQ